LIREMSRGMWTKQYTSSGVPFFYNSTLNKSLWQLPSNEGGYVVHEAENLKKPTIVTGNAEFSFSTQPQIQENHQANIPFDNLQIPAPHPSISLTPPIFPNDPVVAGTLPLGTYGFQMQSTFEQPKQLNPNDEIAERLLQVTPLFLLPSHSLRLSQVK
jgi:hypothetical protein